MLTSCINGLGYWDVMPVNIQDFSLWYQIHTTCWVTHLVCICYQRITFWNKKLTPHLHPWPSLRMCELVSPGSIFTCIVLRHRDACTFVLYNGNTYSVLYLIIYFLNEILRCSSCSDNDSDCTVSNIRRI